MSKIFIHNLAGDYLNFCVKQSNKLESDICNLIDKYNDHERSLYIRVWCVALGISYVEQYLDEQYKVAWDAEVMDALYDSINNIIEEHIESIHRESVYKKAEYSFNLVKEINSKWSNQEIASYYSKVQQLLHYKATTSATEPPIIKGEFESLNFNAILANYWSNFFIELDLFLKFHTIVH
ncbi:MAG: hypothetical protein JEZ08_12595 [Clostridiales bacterium]|nr:hypothetical protein [Clostridiales bacterium]